MGCGYTRDPGHAMPIYEYRCEKCESQFELLVTSSETPACPDCGSEELEKKDSVFGVTDGSTPALPPSPCQGCGTAGGPPT
jgi:putative FmdB family regulatory protein